MVTHDYPGGQPGESKYSRPFSPQAAACMYNDRMRLENAPTNAPLFCRPLVYAHLAIVVVTAVAIVAERHLTGQIVNAIGLTSMLSLPVFAMLSVWLFVLAFEAGSYRRLAIAFVETAFCVLQAGFLMVGLR